ncbi:MAG: TatD family hydrolase [Candidatus Pacebacteria bacterium]|nr:TatD family hydrolase [Candidatus Paceibacterota bacterium]
MQDQIKKENPCLVDTHAHLNFFDYDKDRQETIKRSLEKGIWIINVGTNFQSSQKASAIAEDNSKGVFAAIGLHPTNIDYKKFSLFSQKGQRKPESFLEEDFDDEKYETLTKNKKIAAIGEIGLDYFYKPENPEDIDDYKAKQKEIFEKQLNFSQKKGLPVIIHCRGAHNEMLGILEERKAKGFQQKGVIHCFNGTFAQAERYLQLGLFIGINGIIFKMDLEKTINKIPMDRIVLETDCPFLTPPMAGFKRNEPAFLSHIAEKTAAIKGFALQEISKITTANAHQLFNIK